MSDTLTALRSTAEWCLRVRQGILTPTGRPKKLPVYSVVMCSSCDELSLKRSTEAVDKRKKCQRHLNEVNIGGYWGPATVVCEGDVEVVETIRLSEEGKCIIGSTNGGNE